MQIRKYFLNLIIGFILGALNLKANPTIEAVLNSSEPKISLIKSDTIFMDLHCRFSSTNQKSIIESNSVKPHSSPVLNTINVEQALREIKARGRPTQKNLSKQDETKIQRTAIINPENFENGFLRKACLAAAEVVENQKNKGVLTEIAARFSRVFNHIGNVFKTIFRR